MIRDRDPESKKRAASPARIARRTLEAQGIERDAGIHVGPKAPAMEQHKGLRPESRERDERRPNNKPYKRRNRRRATQR